MKFLNPKLVVSALGIVAVLSSPAFAKKLVHVTHTNPSAVSQPIPGYDEAGATVGIPDPDQR